MENKPINFLKEYRTIIPDGMPIERKLSLHYFLVGAMSSSLSEASKENILDLLRDQVGRSKGWV